MASRSSLTNALGVDLTPTQITTHRCSKGQGILCDSLVYAVYSSGDYTSGTIIDAKVIFKSSLYSQRIDACVSVCNVSL